MRGCVGSVLQIRIIQGAKYKKFYGHHLCLIPKGGQSEYEDEDYEDDEEEEEMGEDEEGTVGISNKCWGKFQYKIKGKDTQGASH